MLVPPVGSTRGLLRLATLALASACTGSGTPDGAKALPADVVVYMGPTSAAHDAAEPVTPDASPPADTGASPADVHTEPEDAAPTGARAPLVFVFTHTTGYRHAAIEAATLALKNALGPLGITVETGADPKVFTPAELARFGGVVLMSTTGKPLGDPGTAALDALSGFVRAGGGLAGIHAASSTEYDPALPYVPLVGGKFVDHPGSVRAGVCHVDSTFAGVARLPHDFPLRDEFYAFSNLRADNQIDLSCDAVTGNGRLPIAWHRDEGAGRVFYTALGHDAVEFAAGNKVLADHMVPGILWTLGR